MKKVLLTLLFFSLFSQSNFASDNLYQEINAYADETCNGIDIHISMSFINTLKQVGNKLTLADELVEQINTICRTIQQNSPNINYVTLQFHRNLSASAYTRHRIQHHSNSLTLSPIRSQRQTGVIWISSTELGSTI